MKHGFRVREVMPALAVLPLLWLAGCGAEDGGPGGARTVDQDACHYLKNGPFPTVSAVKDFSVSAPKVMTDGKAYRVALQKTPTVAPGHVSLPVTAPGEYVFFTSTSLPVVVFDSVGMEIPAKSTTSAITDCTQVKGRHAYDMTLTESYIVRLGPEPAGTVDVVVRKGP
jgi:hypothetical protein